MKKYFIKYKLKIKMSTTNHIPKISDLTSATGDSSERKNHKALSSLVSDYSKPKTETNQLIIEEDRDNIKVRKDIYGNEIKKGGKFKISFVDDPIITKKPREENNEINTKKQDKKIAEVINVESYKMYNKLVMIFDREVVPCDERIGCDSCLIY